MNILDCVTYFDEETILEIRLNVLYKYVTKFIITEGAYDHRGNRRKLNFNLEKYSKFKDKIIYLPVDDFPNLSDPWNMLEYQRNYAMKEINNFKDETFVIVSDVDEIPNPTKINEFIKSKNKFGVFEQLLFYYKLNMLSTSSHNWFGSKICLKKNLKSLNWLRNYKIKQYPWWRLDKPENIYIIKKGGWHFSFLYNVEGIIKKISSYQHTEFDTKDIKDKSKIIKKIEDGQDIFNRNYNFQRINIDDRFPEYLIKNKNKYINWIKE